MGCSSLCPECCGGEDEDHVSQIVKYLVFLFNFIFWLIGGTMIGVGSWAFYEKEQMFSSQTTDIYDIVFDAAVVMIVIGCIVFILAFAGCLGALRENICLLKFFAYSIGIIFILEIIGATLIFVFSTEIKSKVTGVLKDEVIVRYRDDADLRNIIDWAQKTFECCGISDNGYHDWSKNAYFNCTDDIRVAERCGVPFSCCKKPDDIETNLINTACGAGVQLLSIPKASEKVYVRGCVEAVLHEAESNMYLLGGIALGLALPQVFNFFFTMLLALQISDNVLK